MFLGTKKYKLVTSCTWLSKNQIEISERKNLLKLRKRFESSLDTAEERTNKLENK